MTENQDGISIGELSRQVTSVLLRLEGITKRLEDQFVRRDVLELYQKSSELETGQLKEKIAGLDKDKVEVSEFKALEARVTKFEDDKKWLVRLVLGVVIIAVLSLVIVSGGAK